jgi:hypothetical protein
MACGSFSAAGDVGAHISIPPRGRPVPAVVDSPVLREHRQDAMARLRFEPVIHQSTGDRPLMNHGNASAPLAFYRKEAYLGGIPPMCNPSISVTTAAALLALAAGSAGAFTVGSSTQSVMAASQFTEVARVCREQCERGFCRTRCYGDGNSGYHEPSVYRDGRRYRPRVSYRPQWDPTVERRGASVPFDTGIQLQSWD